MAAVMTTLAMSPASLLLYTLVASVAAFLTWTVWVGAVVPYLILRRCRAQGLYTLPFRPFVGQLPEVLAYGRAGKGSPFLELVREGFAAAGPKERVFCFAVRHETRFAVRDPELVRQVFLRDKDALIKPHFIRKLLLPVLGDGLVLSNGEQWARHRQIINPSFHQAKLKAMHDQVVQCASDAMRSWSEKVSSSSSGELDMRAELSELTLSIIGRAALGFVMRGNQQGGQNLEVVADAPRVLSALRRLLVSTSSRFKSPLAAILPFYRLLPTPANRAGWRAAADVRTLLLGAIGARRRAMSEGEEHDDLLSNVLGAADQSLEKGKQRLTDSEVLDEALTFLFAGHETTAQLLSWALYHLCDNPKWEERAREEVMRVCGGPNTPPTPTQLDELKVVSMILNESLRIHPPVPSVVRHVERDVALGEYVAPKGTNIIVSIYSIHRDPELWPDPECFNPDRFGEGVAKACKHPLAFIPFSSGPRNCIGWRFALMEAKIILAMILQRWHFRRTPGQDMGEETFITMRPKSLMLVLEDLTKEYQAES